MKHNITGKQTKKAVPYFLSRVLHNGIRQNRRGFAILEALWLVPATRSAVVIILLRKGWVGLVSRLG